MIKDKVNELQKVKDDIHALYINKNRLEREIMDEVDNHIIQYKQTLSLGDLENMEITIDDVVTIGLLYRNSLNHDSLKEKHPDVYMWGRKIVFDFELALLSFMDKKKFWKVIADCSEKKEKIEIKPIKKGRKKYGRYQYKKD